MDNQDFFGVFIYKIIVAEKTWITRKRVWFLEYGLRKHLNASLGSKIESKMNQNSNMGPAPKRAIRHFWSVDWHKLGPWPEGTWIRLKLILFQFFRDKTHLSSCSNHLAIFSSLPASINRGGLSKIDTFSCSQISPILTLLSIIFPLTLKTF